MENSALPKFQIAHMWGGQDFQSELGDGGFWDLLKGFMEDVLPGETSKGGREAG